MNKKIYTTLRIHFLIFQAQLNFESGPNIFQNMKYVFFWIFYSNMKQREKVLLWEVVIT